MERGARSQGIFFRHRLLVVGHGVLISAEQCRQGAENRMHATGHGAQQIVRNDSIFVRRKQRAKLRASTRIAELECQLR